MDRLGIEPRTFRMLSGCNATTPHAFCKGATCFLSEHAPAWHKYFANVSLARGGDPIQVFFCVPYKHMKQQYEVMGVWRNGSASDSRSEGWEFESLCPHLCRNGQPPLADTQSTGTIIM